MLGISRRGFFIPYRYARAVPRPAETGAYEAIERLFDSRQETMSRWLGLIEAHESALQAIGGDQPPQPRWNQDWFPRMDAAAAYVLTRTVRPGRIVEVGCGHSTRFFSRAVRDGGFDCRIVGIDPAPRADLGGLGGVEIMRSTVQQAGTEPFEPLRAGDILAIDSSHILMPGTDVDMLLNRILPALPAGIYVHVHDIFLPDPYPADWEWRGYNEHQGIAPLIAAASWQVEFASHYVRTRMAERLERHILCRLPVESGAKESSLWLKKL